MTESASVSAAAAHAKDVTLRREIVQGVKRWHDRAVAVGEDRVLAWTVDGETLTGMPEVQFAAITTGQWNLIVALSARSGADTLRLETELEKRLPHATIMDRSMVVRVYKHLGHLLDASGRATREFISLVEDRNDQKPVRLT